jgi:hypothetical protein
MVGAGQKYRVIPAFAKTPTVKGNMQVGQVVYVHPQNRYAVLEFEGVEGNPRECFPLEELTKDNFAGYGKRKRA